jgi:hypothetical protein
LVEFIGEDVFIVCEGDDELDDELAVARYDCAAGAPVCVFPADAVVLLVEADYVGAYGDGAVGCGVGSVEILGIGLEIFGLIEMDILL